MGLADKYRPKDFNEFLGNETTLKVLKVTLKRDWAEINRAFLFVGPSGCGKSTLARIIVNMGDTNGRSLHELNSRNYTGHWVGELIGLSKYSSWGKYRIFLLEECHTIGKKDQNALLKIVENPPVNGFFIFCTTDAKELIDPLKNRCQFFEVKPLEKNQIVQLLTNICKKEKINIGSKVLEQIASSCFGSPRRAINLLEAVRDLSTDEASNYIQRQIEKTIYE